MSESVVMKELRKIREENSLRHANMTSEEISKEYDDAIKWFEEKLGKPLKFYGKNELED